jgi:hypothetical protein
MGDPGSHHRDSLVLPSLILGRGPYPEGQRPATSTTRLSNWMPTIITGGGAPMSRVSHWLSCSALRTTKRRTRCSCRRTFHFV